jgi:hypothetical protein
MSAPVRAAFGSVTNQLETINAVAAQHRDAVRFVLST